MKAVNLKKWFILASLFGPLGVMAQTGESMASAPGTHYGVSDSMILIITLIMATILCILIVTINGAIRNLAESLPRILKERGQKGLVLLALLSGASNSAFAADGSTAPFTLSDSTFWALIFLVFALMAIALYQLSVLKQLIKTVRGEEDIEPKYSESEPTWFSAIIEKLQASVPIEEERDVMMDHEYDGIRELDNVLPPWWKWGFYLSIVFGVLYLLHFHVMKSGDLQIAEYETNVAMAEKAVEEYRMKKSLNVTENSVAFDLSYVASGQRIYTQNCMSCHLSKGEGGVGPNFTDEYWIHGGSIKDIFKTIKYGVPAKGMISWQTLLSPTEMRDVTSFIYTLRDTDPPNQKAPQGEKYIVPGADDQATETTENASAQLKEQ